MATGALDNTPRTEAGERWRRALQTLAPPARVLDAAPDPAPTLEPERFRWRPEEDATRPVRPSRRRALEALPPGGTVLDVGVGGGASSLGLVPRAGLIVGVDPLAGMLAAFEESARAAGVAAQPVLGSWPEVADRVAPAHVAVSHHALYRHEAIEAFLAALTARAVHRVVLELSAQPPLAGLNRLWTAIHGEERPDWAVADAAEAVAHDMGLDVAREDVVLPPHRPEVTPALVAFARRRLYVGPDRDGEIEAYLRAREPQEQRVVALWWPGAAGTG